MEKPLLTDPFVFPSPEVLQEVLADSYQVCEKTLAVITAEPYRLVPEWRYYNDGKQWLFKLTRKQKTIFWAAVGDNFFRITFYFGDKAEEIILKSDIPEELKKGFSGHKGFGKIRPVTVHLLEPNDVENVYKLIKLKISMR